MLNTFKRKLIFLAGSAMVLVSSIAQGWTQLDGRYVWTFLSGEAWPSGYNQNTGKPDDLIYSRDQYPATFFERISNALPEAHVNYAFLTDDAGANITLKEEGEVFVTFIHEGAGYKNSFGYFTFDKNNPPTSAEQIREVIVFPNLSYPHLTNGHRLSLGTFPANTSIGFFIAANGFSYYTGVKDNQVPFYYSLKGLNPETDPALQQHNVLLYDEEVKEVIIGFEDLPRTWGDNDFNDAVFAVRATPASALETSNLTTVPDVDDSDADGIPDSDDEFPDDFARAFSSFYPSANDWITLAFEDNWPANGDYDMNDLVIREQLQVIYDANGGVSGFRINGFIDARGAAYRNGFALRLLETSPSLLESAILTVDNQRFNKAPESDQSDLVLILWQDTHKFTMTNEAGSCQHFNTVSGCTRFDPVPFELDVRFAQRLTQLSHAKFDFFLFRKDFRSREIHLADYPPTDLFDQTQFGKFDDTSDPASGRYFRNEYNLPWAIMIPSQWKYPLEYIDVVWAFPEYEQWVESSGNEKRNWYASGKATHQF